MKLNKKALSTAITLSLVLGAYGTALAEDPAEAPNGLVNGFHAANVTPEDGYSFAVESVKDLGTVISPADFNKTDYQYIMGDYSSTAAVTGKTLTIDDGNLNAAGSSTHYLYAGHAYSASAAASATGNTLTVNGGTLGNNDDINVWLAGGFARAAGSGAATASKNSVDVNDGVTNFYGNAVYGGFAYAESGNATANYNEVNFAGGAKGTIYTDLEGGYASGDTATANVNTVTIASGTVTAAVAGGYAVGDTEKAEGNTVNITGGTVTGNVVGGRACGWATTDDINNNEVNIFGAAANLTNATLYGYYVDSVEDDDESIDYAYHSGNTLNVAADWEGSDGTHTVGSIKNFDVLNFAVPSEGTLALVVNDSVDLESVVKFNLDSTNYNGHDTITLLKDAAGITNVTDAMYAIDGTFAKTKYFDTTITNISNVQSEAGYSTQKTGENVTEIDFGPTGNYGLSADSSVKGDVTGLTGTLNLNGHNLQGTVSGASITVASDKALTIVGNKNANISNLTIDNDGTMKLDKVVLGSATQDATVVFSGNGTVDLTNTSIYANGTNALATVLGTKADDSVTLNTGSFIYTSSGQVFSTDPTTSEVNVNQKIIKYTSGTLVFNDPTYTKAYVLNAADALTNTEKGGTAGSQTQIVMTGEMTDDPANPYTTTDAASTDGKIALDNAIVTVKDTTRTAGSSTLNLVVGTTWDELSGDAGVKGTSYESTYKRAATADGSVTAAALKLIGEDPQLTSEHTEMNIAIKYNEKLTLGSSEGGNPIIYESLDGTTTQVFEGSVHFDVAMAYNSETLGETEAKGTLVFGNALAKTTTEYSVNGSATILYGGTLINNGTTTFTDKALIGGRFDDGTIVLNDGNIQAGNGKLTAINLKAIGDDTANNTVTGNMTVTNLTEKDTTSVLNLGSDDATNGGKAVVSIENADLNGGLIFIDPVWGDGYNDASKVAVNDTALNGKYFVGQNSMLILGTNNTDAAEIIDLATANSILDRALNACNLKWDESGITSGVYIYQNVDLTDSKSALYADGSYSSTNKPAASDLKKKVSFAANSLLMVSGANVIMSGGKSSALTIAKGDKVSIDANSVLYVDGAQKGEIYKIIGVADGSDYADNATDSFWTDETKILTDTQLIKLHRITGTGNVTMDGTYDPSSVYGNLLAKNATDTTWNEGTPEQQKFIRSATNAFKYSKAAQQDNLNSVAAMTELAGVEHNAYTANGLFVDAVDEHISLAKNLTHDYDVWAKYIHSKESVDSFSIGGLMGAEYDAQYNGIVAGLDLYHKNKGTVGVALTYMEGDTNGNTLATHTRNDSKYYGVSLYGAIENRNTATIGDITYLHSSNDIKQYNSGSELTGSAKADSFSLGVKAEAKYESGANKFVPYVGLRLLHLGIGDYSNSLGMSYNTDEKNMAILPLGVKYTFTQPLEKGAFRTYAELGYVVNLTSGDSKQNISWNGSDSYEFDLADRGTLNAKLGFELTNRELSYGVGYEFAKSSNTRDNRFTANLNWKF